MNFLSIKKILNFYLLSFTEIQNGKNLTVKNLFIENLFTEKFSIFLLTNISSITFSKISIFKSFFLIFLHSINSKNIQLISFNITANSFKTSFIYFQTINGINILDDIIFNNNQYENAETNDLSLFLTIKQHFKLKTDSLKIMNSKLYQNTASLKRNLITMINLTNCLFENLTFEKNFANYVIFSNTVINLSFNNFSCISNNLNEGFKFKGKSCLFLENSNKILVDNSLFIKNYAITVAGIIIIQDSEIITMNQKSLIYSIKNTNFSENSVDIITENPIYIGCSIYIDSPGKLIIYRNIFKKNINVHRIVINKREGNPCLNSKNLFNFVEMKQSKFFSNQANFQSNCLYFRGKTMKLLENKFENNSFFAKYKNRIEGGALMVTADILLIKNCFFNNNIAEHGGGIGLFVKIAFYLHVYQIENSQFKNNYAKDGGAMQITSNNL